MKMSGEFVFIGVEARPGFADQNKMNYLIGLAQGLDTYRTYIEAPLFQKIQTMIMQNKLSVYETVHADCDFNPAATKVSYCMKVLDIKSLKEGKVNA